MVVLTPSYPHPIILDVNNHHCCMNPQSFHLVPYTCVYTTVFSSSHSSTTCVHKELHELPYKHEILCIKYCRLFPFSDILRMSQYPHFVFKRCVIVVVLLALCCINVSWLVSFLTITKTSRILKNVSSPTWVTLWAKFMDVEWPGKEYAHFKFW